MTRLGANARELEAQVSWWAERNRLLQAICDRRFEHIGGDERQRLCSSGALKCAFPDFLLVQFPCPVYASIRRSCWLRGRLSRPPKLLHGLAKCKSRRETNLEDIGDGDSVLGVLALGGDDGDGRPGHGVDMGVVLWLVVAMKFDVF